MSKSSSPTNQAVLELTDIHKQYKMGDTVIHALKGISLRFKKGELISIVGPSGSGKSTLLQIAGLLDKPSSGSIKVNGKALTSFDERTLAKVRNKDFGFVFQQFNLLKKTSALENVALPLLYGGVKKSLRDKRAEEVLGLVGLGDRLDNTPAQLSGGQQQRVAIARALVNDPSVIFADEPTGNLDSKTGDEIIALLKDLHKQGKTILIVTHEEDVAKIASHRVTIRDGQVDSSIFRGK